MSQPTASTSRPRPGTPSSRLPRWFRRVSIRRKRRARRAMKAVANNILDVLQTMLDLGDKAADDAGVPFLKLGLGALKEVVRKIQLMRSNVEGVETLDERIAELSNKVQAVYARLPGEPLPPEMGRRIETATTKWSRIAEQAREIKSYGVIKRFFSGNSDARRLEGLVQEINNSIQVDIIMKGVLNNEKIAHSIQHDVEAIHEEVRAGNKTIEAEKLDASFILVYAKNAQYDASNARNQCLQGTRVGVLKRLYNWISLAISHRDLLSSEDPGPGSIFWVNGFAGAGKTTIACSVAQHCRELRILGATFFCSRFDAECSDANVVFTTISRQLCYFHPPFKEKVATILKGNPTIVHAGIDRQFEELILIPLEELGDAFPLTVIVIDALDECSDKKATSTLLSTIAKYAARIARFLLFVATSRPEPHIATLFERSLRGITRPLPLHTIELDSVIDDIQLYLEDGFRRNPGNYKVALGWPSGEDLNRLANLSHGLFIWAATALLFIMDEAFCDPEGQLQRLLRGQLADQAQETRLQSLYQQVTEAITTSEPLTKRLRSILGALALAQEPLSTTTLAGLVAMQDNLVRNALVGLRSVLHIPEKEDETIHIIHPTFAEFLLDSTVNKPEAFRIHPGSQHAALLSHCLEIMEHLKRNIAGIGGSTAFKSEVLQPSNSVEKYISPHLSYACRHWSAHLDGCTSNGLPQTIYELLHKFLYNHLLHWLEACGLLGAMDGAIAALEAAQRACQRLGGSFVSLVPLLANCHRFALAFSTCIAMAPLQVYHSALALAPTETPISKEYIPQLLDNSLIVRHGAPARWAPCVDTFVAHGGGSVFCAVFSPDGRSFATGGVDKKVTIWKTDLRTRVQSFVGHSGWVRCAAFSPDGSQLASGSNDKTVRIWQVLSGDCVRILEGHTDLVNSVAFSVNGTRIISTTQQGEVKLWDAVVGRCLLTPSMPIENRSDTCQAAISPDGGVIAHSNSCYLCLYNISSKITETMILLPGQMQACAFSPNGRYVVARTHDTIHIWRCEDKSLVRSIDCTLGRLTGRMAFSPDSTHICYGTNDGCICLLQITSEEAPHMYKGHNGTQGVSDISWSRDRLQIVSGSFDGTASVWDVTELEAYEHTVVSGCLPPVPVDHNGTIVHLNLPFLDIDDHQLAASSVNTAYLLNAALRVTDDITGITRACNWAFLTDRQTTDIGWRPVCGPPHSFLVAFLSPNCGTVAIFDLRTEALVAYFTGHETAILLSVTFSPDGRLVATGSTGETLKVWNLTTRVLAYSHEQPASEDSGWVSSSAFSSDNRLIASASFDASIHVVEVATWRVKRAFAPHQTHNITVAEIMFSADNAHILSLDRANQACIWDIDMGSCIWKTSFWDDSWINSLTFSPDGTGIVIGDNDEMVRRTISLWRPDSRVWPVFMVSKEGWVYGKSPGRTARLCWLPSEWRNVFSLTGTTFCAPDTRRRRIVVFDVSRLPEYVETWGSHSK